MRPEVSGGAAGRTVMLAPRSRSGSVSWRGAATEEEEEDEENCGSHFDKPETHATTPAADDTG